MVQPSLLDTRYDVADFQFFAGFGWGDGGVDGKPVKMIEALGVGPFGEGVLSLFHEFFLEIGDALAAVGVTRRHDAALAGVVAKEFDGADLEGLRKPSRRRRRLRGLRKRPRRQSVPNWRENGGARFQWPIRETSLATACRLARLRMVGAESFTVVREAFDGFVAHGDGESKEIAQPFSEGGQVVQWKLRGGLVFLPEADFADLGVELRAQVMDAGGSFSVYDFSVGVVNGEDAVVFQDTAGGEAGGFDGETVESLDGKDLDATELQYCGDLIR